MIGSVARAFWDWWLEQLRELIPSVRRGATKSANAVLIIAPDFSKQDSPATVTARIERRGHAERLGRITLDSDGLRALKRAAATLGRTPETLLEVPLDAVLEKRLVLPLAAERELDQVLALAMDRETPFAADEVYWKGEPEQRDRAKRLLTVRLSMVAKAQIADTVAVLSRAALKPTALIGAGQDGRRTVIALDHGEARRRSVATTALAWTCAVLGIAAIVCAIFAAKHCARSHRSGNRRPATYGRGGRSLAAACRRRSPTSRGASGATCRVRRSAAHVGRVDGRDPRRYLA